MFDEPEERSSESAADPKVRAREKADELGIHAQLAAVFEGPRKFDAQLIDADVEMAREVQMAIGRLEKAKTDPLGPVLPPSQFEDAAKLLSYPDESGISFGDYHIARRPGEVQIIRWLDPAQVETFYERLQAHFAAAMTAQREDERSNNAWKGDPTTLAYLDALDAENRDTAERYLREPIRKLRIYALSTLAVDEMNIAHLCGHLMGVSADQVVGDSAPADDAPDQELAWYFKLFALRGTPGGAERMCFFTYLQKSDDLW